MTKKEFEKTVFDAFGVAPDHPFDEDFETAVLRHTDNRKRRLYSYLLRIKAR